MTALAADSTGRKPKEGMFREYLMKASTTIYKGSLVCMGVDGKAAPAANTAGFSAVRGVAMEKVVSASSGSYYVRVQSGITVTMAATSAAQTWVGRPVFVTDDNTVALTGSAGVVAGICERYRSSSSVDVFIPTGGVNGYTMQPKFSVIAGGSAGALTVTGIAVTHRLLWVGVLDRNATAANITWVDLTSEFSITAANTIDNTSGTSTSGDVLVVIYV